MRSSESKGARFTVTEQIPRKWDRRKESTSLEGYSDGSMKICSI